MIFHSVSIPSNHVGSSYGDGDFNGKICIESQSLQIRSEVLTNQNRKRHGSNGQVSIPSNQVGSSYRMPNGFVDLTVSQSLQIRSEVLTILRSRIVDAEVSQSLQIRSEVLTQRLRIVGHFCQSQSLQIRSEVLTGCKREIS